MSALGSETRVVSSPFGFKEIPHGVDLTHHVPRGYRAEVLIRWGDPLQKGLPDWDPNDDRLQDAGQRFGYNNDFIAYLPLPAGAPSSSHGLLCVNHEYSSPRHMLPGVNWVNILVTMSRTRTDNELAAIGHSIVEVQRDAAGWRYVNSGLNRRFSAHSTIALSGPAAGHRRLRSREHPQGMTTTGLLGLCGGGKTPWGTVLVAEENFNFYFGGLTADAVESRNHWRYGAGTQPLYPWWLRHYPRFRINESPTAPNGYGWVVEIDPYDPESVPVKRTALGRFKHEAATCVLDPAGHAVVYSGDDEVFEYLYRFVSHGVYDPHDRHANHRLLDTGVLSVARFDDAGGLEWKPLVHGEGPLTAKNGFRDQGDCVIEARRAADLVGATRLDRPEDVETNPYDGAVYVLLTNNAARKSGDTDRANPRAANRFGHILKLTPPSGDGGVQHSAQEFEWEVFLLAGDPADATHAAYYRGDISKNGWFASPDNCAFDSSGHMWIATDQGKHWKTTGFADGVWACATHGDAKGTTRHFLRAPIGAEVCGPEFTPDGRTLFVAIQHPGVDGVAGASFDTPGTRWPDFVDGRPPRPSVLAITREDGGPIGT